MERTKIIKHFKPIPDMEKMKSGAILANMGHSNTEFDIAR